MLIDYKGMRVPVLAKRDECERKGDKEGVAECNAELCRLNLAIKGIRPYKEPEPELTQQQKAAITRKANQLKHRPDPLT